MIYYMGYYFAHGNDAAIQIAVSVAGTLGNFSELMNNKAKELNLENTHFITPHGLDEEEHYTTAYELALIADYAVNIEKISQVVNTKAYTVNINGYSKTITNTNELLGYLNGVNGVKTGFTNGAGRCLVSSCNRNSFNIITVVLGADTKKIRTKDSITLIEYIYSNYEVIDLENIISEEYKEWSKKNKNKINIIKSKSEEIKLEKEECNFKRYPIKKEEIKDIKIDIRSLNLQLEAPVFCNTKIAEITVCVRENEILKINILIANNIKRKNILDYFFECIISIARKEPPESIY